MDGIAKRTERLEQVVVRLWNLMEQLHKQQLTQHDNVAKLADVINASNRQHCDNARALADGLKTRQVGKAATVLNVNVPPHPTRAAMKRDANGEPTGLEYHFD